MTIVFSGWFDMFAMVVDCYCAYLVGCLLW